VLIYAVFGMLACMNELLFIFHSAGIALGALGMYLLGPAALTAYVAVQAVLANLFVVKQMSLFGFNATCADAFAVGTTLALNLLQEYYGKEYARRALVSAFCMLIFYMLTVQLHLAYQPSTYDFAHEHYAVLLAPMPRIIIASFIAYLVAQIVDYTLYGFFKKILQGAHLTLRNSASLAISQLVDTILFGLLGLYGVVGAVWQIIMVSYVVKLAAILIAVPLASLAAPLSRWRR
jgi:queuosine precursor transporter